ncbi:TlyA family rRNA (cytidine-2'-O)-methyltransferase [Pleomorphomonas diazotrophica]|uniref:TlyA family rRNA (Cytidine-2'-O)-methyltransferase n=1 Tax=Pleomorphomonas diazotrophica TaxID=1166257 RepID=A0A1I4SCF6_9HYPH|nr:TlyA family RNA methyltransferase [Pleomorphomonas diazotrophica]PKR88855.1 TlyA family rRNA (cytidine-2'-O)-methyltransferase [Pleomorphomonas diazotrophica]SFM62196.1 23S rRNA (cytidine1920-2'-O)/16S rRNA (cytidine1409-2'-O)-methyltransferase [Pleomorphomonas diazotrophica]
MARIRLDQLLVARGFAESRARARDAILRGHVTVAGQPADKPGLTIEEDAELGMSDPAAAYVSRAALKLVAGLDHFGFDVSNRDCLDVGASTGGFTEVLLQRGAARVVALDVGHGQLHPRIAGDPRVSNIEGLNARELTSADLPFRPEVIVSDVSFISLTLALPPALTLARRPGLGLFLVKPQFEAGRQAIGKGGLVDEATGRAAAERLRAWLDGRDGWRVHDLIPSPILGGDGNHEYLLGASLD